jgi:hypothetical protein
LAGYDLPRRTNDQNHELRACEAACQDLSLLFSLTGLPLARIRTCDLKYVNTSANRFRRSIGLCFHPSGGKLAAIEYNGIVGYQITAADGGASVNLTDPEWRALIYVASQHDFSAPHLRLERGGESLDLGGSDAEGLRSALGKALEARDREAIKTPDGELAYDVIQRVRHVLLAGDVRLARTPA